MKALTYFSMIANQCLKVNYRCIFMYLSISFCFLVESNSFSSVLKKSTWYGTNYKISSGVVSELMTFSLFLIWIHTMYSVLKKGGSLHLICSTIVCNTLGPYFWGTFDHIETIFNVCRSLQNHEFKV